MARKKVSRTCERRSRPNMPKVVNSFSTPCRSRIKDKPGSSIIEPTRRPSEDKLPLGHFVETRMKEQ